MEKDGIEMRTYKLEVPATLWSQFKKTMTKDDKINNILMQMIKERVGDTAITEKQKKELERLGYKESLNLTKKEAWQLIKDFKDKKLKY